MSSLSIFCGANSGNRPEYKAAALTFVEAMVDADITLVYGGGNIGLMGDIANHALSLGGRVIGVMPQKIVDLELVHTDLTELHVVDSMSERKQKLGNISDGCIALPGGTGTLDELMEEIVLVQTGFHNKPVGLLNTLNYYGHLMSFFKHGVEEGYINWPLDDILTVENDPECLLQVMQQKIQQP